MFVTALLITNKTWKVTCKVEFNLLAGWQNLYTRVSLLATSFGQRLFFSLCHRQENQSLPCTSVTFSNKRPCAVTTTLSRKDEGAALPLVLKYCYP